MSLKKVFIIKDGKVIEGEVIDFMKAKKDREPIDPNDMKLSFEDYADGPFPYEDYNAQEKIDFRRLYISRYGDQPIGADEWNALHDEFDARPKHKLSVVPREE